MPTALLLALLFFLPSMGFSQVGKCLVGDCKEGYGHFQWFSGEEYLGNFQGGLRQGYGVFYWQDRRKFVGTWKKGKMNGEGLLFHPNGRLQRGVWRANNFIKLLRPPYQLSTQHLAHGKKQLQQLLQDRPSMQTLVQLDDPIAQWVMLQLAGSSIKTPIYWQDSTSRSFPIPSGVNAVHSYPTAKTEARVWVNPNAIAEQQWAGLIYELHNIQNGPDFELIEKDAQQFRCTQEEYIMRYARLEYKAAQATAQFYEDLWKPFCKSQGRSTIPQYWFYYLPPTFEEWAVSFTDKKGYPWHPYEGYYQKILQTALKRY
ncbi:MAG: hypothetical protein ACRBFS_24760 [Aureispira sp.]